MVTMANGASLVDSPDNDYNGAEQPPYTVIQKYEVNYEAIKPGRIVDNGSLMQLPICLKCNSDKTTIKSTSCS